MKKLIQSIFPFKKNNIKTTVMKEIYAPTSITYEHRRAICFAGYSANCVIDKNVILYLKELKKYSDYIVYVTDNNIIPSELKKIKNIVDAVICERHNEYDFGSYKRGYFLLKEQNILEKVDSLLFVNDSVIYNGKSLKEVFDLSENKPFYGLTVNSHGYNKLSEGMYGWIKAPHIQSFFAQVSKDIFNSNWFYDFMQSIQHLENKKDIIINYEMGMSKLIQEHGYSLNSFYEYTDDDIDPCRIHCNPKVKTKPYQILVKKYLLRQQQRLTFIQQIFSIKNDARKKHKVITVLGIKIKIKIKKPLNFRLNIQNDNKIF